MIKQHPILQKYAAEAQRFFEKLPAGEIEKMNHEHIMSTEIEYREFKNQLKNGICYLCGDEVAGFSEEKPCMHWLLRPTGFDKEHFPIVFKRYNFFRLESYLRWIANSDILAGNINDLEEEKNPKKLLEHTIKYRDFEWSFSCSEGDLAGHRLRFSGRFPHYHFQMRIKGRSFINYSEFHIPFTEEDLFQLPILLNMVEKAKFDHTHGAGMQEMMSIDPEILLSSMEKADNKANGVFNVQTLVEAEPGKKLSGDEIANLFKKSREMNVPVARLIKELKNVGEVKTIISPGPRVPDQAGRKGGR